MDIKNVVVDYWNFRSASYTNGISGFCEEERDAWKRILSDALPPGKRLRVLDVGTGAGFLALLFTEMGHEVSGVDISTGMLEKARSNARELGADVNFSLGDAENLPFEDNSFDLVVNKYLLWTLPEPPRALEEWKRVLKPGGQIYAIDGNWFDPGLLPGLKRFLKSSFRKVVKKDRCPSFFQECYTPIRPFLPLYRDINPENVSELFMSSGLTEVEADPLLGIRRFEDSRLSFLQRVFRDYPIFLISGTKKVEKS
ncbi:class I SAM-dependent methyltransferase [Methanosarcina sp. Mfa9]|uniref:class I SAM-dependent methyltransferase n=1 Tax=Methanosarcina sp. Mfa9 TaxID=3439063 RepID=UPI003F84D01C